MVGVLVLMLSFASGTWAASPDSAAPYAERLENVRELARRYPIGARGLGEWGAIYDVTAWQLETGRDRIAIWEIPNRAATIAPLEYARRLAAEPGYGCEDVPSKRDAATCLRWLKLFRYVSGRRASSGPARWHARHLLWQAHNAAIFGALTSSWSEVSPENREDPTPVEERYFQLGRARLLLLLEAENFPMTERSVSPYIRWLDPRCAPLGAPGCEVRDFRTSSQRNYVKLMIREGQRFRPVRSSSSASPRDPASP